MFTERTNEDRAERAMSALNQYVNVEGDDPNANDWQTWLQDMLTDLRHLCARDGLDFDAAVASSEFHFDAEIEEEETEPTECTDPVQALFPKRDDEGRTAQDRYDDACIEQYGAVEIDTSLNY